MYLSPLSNPMHCGHIQKPIDHIRVGSVFNRPSIVFFHHEYQLRAQEVTDHKQYHTMASRNVSAQLSSLKITIDLSALHITNTFTSSMSNRWTLSHCVAGTRVHQRFHSNEWYENTKKNQSHSCRFGAGANTNRRQPIGYNMAMCEFE